MIDEKLIVYDIDLSEDEYEYLLEDEEACEEFLEQILNLY